MEQNVGAINFLVLFLGVFNNVGNADMLGKSCRSLGGVLEPLITHEVKQMSHQSIFGYQCLF